MHVASRWELWARRVRRRKLKEQLQVSVQEGVGGWWGGGSQIKKGGLVSAHCFLPRSPFLLPFPCLSAAAPVQALLTRIQKAPAPLTSLLGSLDE
jgi:hypothetical protein